ncbi:phage major capsid protein [Bradyrhizobium sp. I71]|uniref:phage major capsid protein n=1 Tax=Bradyrhizobium sp. I71 TaxID=2590772 RepID=UPI001EF77142|nr:phage major capsid protein [Bradyrhizobium sp. I71]ULK98855.1 phage major capsid protein [Bradyrhizobium sp. I71]
MKRYVLAGAFALAVCAVLAVLATHGIAGDHHLIMAAAGTAAVSADDLKALTTQLTTIEQSMAKAADDVKKSGETMQTEMKNLGKATAETTEKVDKALSQHGELAEKHGEIASRVTEIEQKLAARRSEQEPASQKSMGERFVESAEFKGFKGKGAIRVQMNRADITNVTGTVGSNTSSSNSLVTSMRVPGIVTPPERKLTIRDLIAPGETAQGMVEFVQETGYTNNAAVVTEGATKPKSDLTFELKNAPVRTIAHIFKASRQILDDAPALRSYIDARARYGLRLTEETELLNGDGTGIHIKGLVPSATAFDAQFVPANQTNIDVIRLAILQVFLANFPASGIVLHPTDWAKIQLTKDGQQRYIIGDPQNGNAPRLWNLPVVESQSMTVTEFLVGAFDLGAQIFDRMEIEVLLSTENSDDFEKNMVTLRAEERLALAIYRPESFIHGDFDTAT